MVRWIKLESQVSEVNEWCLGLNPRYSLHFVKGV